jgi:hypothetical protein
VIPLPPPDSSLLHRSLEDYDSVNGFAPQKSYCSLVHEFDGVSVDQVTLSRQVTTEISTAKSSSVSIRDMDEPLRFGWTFDQSPGSRLNETSNSGIRQRSQTMRGQQPQDIAP